MDFLFLVHHPKENSSVASLLSVDLHQLEEMPSARTASGFFLDTEKPRHSLEIYSARSMEA